jgi:anti-anti-sigma regulatory factor
MNLKIAQTGHEVIVHISGPIDETADFSSLLALKVSEARVTCRDVTRINSIGVKNWINAFQKLVSKGMKISLIDCAPVIVEQLNIIINFSSGMTVESLMLPFMCEKCKKGSNSAFKADDLRKLNFQIPAIKCPTCAAPSAFDDIAEDYFTFLRH